MTALLALAKSEALRVGLRFILRGLEKSLLLHDPAVEMTRRALVALIRACMCA
jgi:hypothetical protein